MNVFFKPKSKISSVKPVVSPSACNSASFSYSASIVEMMPESLSIVLRWFDSNQGKLGALTGTDHVSLQQDWCQAAPCKQHLGSKGLRFCQPQSTKNSWLWGHSWGTYPLWLFPQVKRYSSKLKDQRLVLYVHMVRWSYWNVTIQFWQARGWETGITFNGQVFGNLTTQIPKPTSIKIHIEIFNPSLALMLLSNWKTLEIFSCKGATCSNVHPIFQIIIIVLALPSTFYIACMQYTYENL